MTKTSLEKDAATLWAMGRIYCKNHHGTLQGTLNEKGLCPECSEVIEYALVRTQKCPNEHKGNCDECTIRCYKPAYREKIKRIMAFAGPRMIFHHPIMAIRHLKKKGFKERS